MLLAAPPVRPGRDGRDLRSPPVAPPKLHDVACVVHLHSTYSDGTGTVPEIAKAARRAGVEVVLLTDHDSMEARRRGEERWWGPVLVLVGEEVTPPNENHLLAFGIEREVDPGLGATGICRAVVRGGGIGFAAHPFSHGSRLSRRFGTGYPWRSLDVEGLTGIELWSFVTDTGEQLSSFRELLRFLHAPGHVINHPPARNVAAWDRLCERRRVVAIGGLDAHQFGVRIRGRVPLRLMSYRRSFEHLRTHVLCREPLGGDVERDRSAVYSALREGRCYLAMDSLAPARGFRFWAEGERAVVMGEEAPAGEWTLQVRLPRSAAIRIVRGGEVIAAARGRELERGVAGPGAYRVQALLDAWGRSRTWIMSNPIYLRQGGDGHVPPNPHTSRGSASPAVREAPTLAQTTRRMAATSPGPRISPSTARPISAATAGSRLMSTPKTCAGRRRSASSSSE